LGGQGRYSYFALDTPSCLLTAKNRELTIQYLSKSQSSQSGIKIGNPLDRLMEWMSDYCAPHVDGLPPFWGGLVGYFGYDASQYVDERIAHLMQARKDAPEKTADDFQDFEFGFFDQVGVVDHFRKRLWLVDTVLLPKGTVRSPAAVERMYRSAQNRLRRQAVRLQRAIRSNRSWGEFQADRVRSNKSEAAYRLMVRRAKGFIEAGDIYQANLSQRFNGVWKGNPWALYRHLSRINPSPYAGLWRSGSKWIHTITMPEAEKGVPPFALCTS
jgi:anthranilate/para-aminobenzoate synthase component I